MGNGSGAELSCFILVCRVGGIGLRDSGVDLGISVRSEGSWLVFECAASGPLRSRRGALALRATPIAVHVKRVEGLGLLCNNRCRERHERSNTSFE